MDKIALSKLLKRKAFRFFKLSSRWVNKLPFAGKLLLRPTVLSVYTSSKERRHLKVLGAFLLLILCIVGHSSQVLMGITQYLKNSSMLLKGMWLTYVLANVMAVYTQCIILIRVSAYLLRAKRTKQRNLSRGIFRAYSVVHTLLCLVVTGGGQIVALSFL